MIPLRRFRTAAGLAAAALSSLTACQLEPDTPKLHYELNTSAIAENADLADDEAAQARLKGGLEFLFGTPSDPSFLVLADWRDEEFDPNYWGYDLLSDEEFAALEESNAAAYADQIAAIEAGDLDAVEEPRYAADLWRRWVRFRKDFDESGAQLGDLFDEGDPEAGTWRDQAVREFVGYYPTLRASAELYRQQCFHCHGAEGGGDGSTADFLNPRPRDYRPGKFKFTALNNKARPRHRDLFRILGEGIYTTAMPSFRRFSDAQLHGLADYVRLLSMRGETEILIASDYEWDTGINMEMVQETYELVADNWRANDDEVIVYEGEVPEATPERIAHGRHLFNDETGANCVSCHGVSGRGDGPSAWERNPESGELELAKDDWGNPIVPRDLTRDVFRFGRRPIDIFRRIYAGINGTPMPAQIGVMVTEEDGSQHPMTEDDIWDIVHYVRSLSSHPMEMAHASGADHSGDDGHGSGH